MSFNKYYQDELNYLRELGNVFSASNPGLSRFLSEDGDDPDVERLLEGFAFLTGRLRQKLDDEFPEVSHSLINLLWPNYLRPVPSMSVLEFTPRKHSVTTKQLVKKGASVQSIEVDKSVCYFRSSFDVEVAPLKLSEARTKDKTDGSEIDLEFEIDPGVASEEMGLSQLRIFLHDDQKRPVAKVLYLWLFRYLVEFDIEITLRGGEKKQYVGLDKSDIQPVGFKDSEALLPGTETMFSGYRLLQEYFLFPEKFLFFDITGLGDILNEPKIEKFKVKFNFSRHLDNQIKIKKENFRLFCTPIVNLFDEDADPIRIEHLRHEYMLRPHHGNLQHIEIFSVDKVVGKQKGAAKRVEYPPFESFEHQNQFATDTQSVFYKLNIIPSVLGDGVDHHIHFVHQDDEKDTLLSETVSTQLTCTNRKLAQTLLPGQINRDSGNSPEFVQFKNITRVTNSLSPPFENNMHWRMIANMALNYTSLATVEALRLIVKFYDFRAFSNRQQERTNQQLCEGIERIKTEETDRLLKGIPIIGLKTTLHLRESKFGASGVQGEASMFLFASIMNHYFAQYARTNSFHQFRVIAVESGEEYLWSTQTGKRSRF